MQPDMDPQPAASTNKERQIIPLDELRVLLNGSSFLVWPPGMILCPSTLDDCCFS